MERIPTPMPPQKHAIPAELTQLRQWCLWRLTSRDGKPCKTPFTPSGSLAKSNDPATWSDFSVASSEFAANPSKWSGLGFVFSESDPYCGIDLDGCRDPATGFIAGWAKAIVEQFATYSEISPSGTGIKLWCRGQWSHKANKIILTSESRVCNKTPAVEVYDKLRYFAVTGSPVVLNEPPLPIADCQVDLDLLHKRLWSSPPPAAPHSTATASTRGNIVDRAAKYIAKCPASVSGQDGSAAAIRVACELFRFGLTDTEARQLFDEFNGRCLPPWSDREIEHKLSSARNKVVESGEFGCHLKDGGTSGGSGGGKSNKKSKRKKNDQQQLRRSNTSGKHKPKATTELTLPILSRLSGVQKLGEFKWSATCPVHFDATLAIGVGRDGAVITCPAGCGRIDVLKSLTPPPLASDLYLKRVATVEKSEPATEVISGDSFDNSDSDSPNESASDPHRLTRVFLGRFQFDGQVTVRFWRGVWYHWIDGYYSPLDPEDMRCLVVQSIKDEFDRINIERLKTWEPKDDDDLPPQVLPVTTAVVSNTMQALRSACLLHGSIEPPSLLSDINGLSTTATPAKHLVALKNGVLDLRKFLSDADDAIIPHSPSFFTLAALPVDFDLNAKCPAWNKFLKRNLNNDDRSEMLQEWFGLSATFNNSFQSFLMLEGSGSNGKSVICAALAAFLGSRNVSHVPLECFGETFHLSATIGKLANIASEIGEIEKASEGTLKAYTSGDRMTFNRKNLPLFDAVPTARLVMATNTLPRFADRSNGVWRRMLLLPLDAVIKDDEKVAGMDSVEWWAAQPDELSGILLWALAGLARLNEQRRFTKPAAMVEAIKEYQLECFPARRFLEETYEVNPTGEVSTMEAYQLYEKWCKSHGNKPQAAGPFGKEIKKTFPTAELKRWVIRHDGSRGPGYTGIEVKEPASWVDAEEDKKMETAEKISSLFD